MIYEMKALLAPLLTRQWTLRQRAALADALMALADEQRQLASALTREQRRPASHRQTAGKGGRPSVPWLRIDYVRHGGRTELELRIKLSRALYTQLGSPARLDVQRVQGTLILSSVRGDQGYAVTVNAGGVWINASGSRDLVREEPGRYAVEVRAGRVAVGKKIENK